MNVPLVVKGLEKRTLRFRARVARLEVEVVEAREQLALAAKALIAMQELANKQSGIGDVKPRQPGKQ
jgi:hypothetical protein